MVAYWWTGDVAKRCRNELAEAEDRQSKRRQKSKRQKEGREGSNTGEVTTFPGYYSPFSNSK